MEKNLELIKTDVFEEVECDIYSNGDEMMMTINQLAKVVDYSNGRKGIDNLIARKPYLKEKEFSVTLKLRGTDGKDYETRVFTEDGILEIAMIANTEKSKRFRKWIRKVLKDLRKNGVAMTNDFVEMTLQDPEYAMKVIGQYAAEKRKREELMAINEQQRNNIVALKATVEEQNKIIESQNKDLIYLEMIKGSSSALAISQIAGEYGCSPQDMNLLLLAVGFFKHINGQWLLKEPFVGHRLTVSTTENHKGRRN